MKKREKKLKGFTRPSHSLFLHFSYQISKRYNTLVFWGHVTSSLMSDKELIYYKGNIKIKKKLNKLFCSEHLISTLKK